MVEQVGAEISQTLRLGRRQYRRDTKLLHAAASASQTHEIHQYAGTAQRRDQTANARGADIPQRSQLPAFDSGADHRDARELDRSDPLLEHGPVEGTQKGLAPSDAGCLNASQRADPNDRLGCRSAITEYPGAKNRCGKLLRGRKKEKELKRKKRRDLMEMTPQRKSAKRHGFPLRLGKASPRTLSFPTFPQARRRSTLEN